MRIEILENRSQSDPRAWGGMPWTGNFDTSQRFKLRATTNDEEEVGSIVGLVQNLTATSRVATYENGGTLEKKPQRDAPCLDADVERIPWYNEACEGQSLPDVGGSIELVMDDSPSANVPCYLLEGKEPRNITSLKVDETFSLSLYDKTNNKTLQQWTWTYSWTLLPNTSGSVYATPRIDNSNADIAKPQHPVQEIVLEGPVATAEPVRDILPTGWKIPE